MKLIITEEQLRMIVENEGKNLLDFTGHKNNPEEWDDMFEHVNRKKGGKYDGYYINGNINLGDSEVTELKHLVMVNGNLIASGSKIKSLGKLERVTKNLKLTNTSNLKSLGNLKYVGFDLNLDNSEIEDLGYLNQVGRSLDIRFTPKLKSLGEESQEFSGEEFKKGYKIFVGDFLSVAGTGLSEKQIDKIKHNWLSKSMFGY